MIPGAHHHDYEQQDSRAESSEAWSEPNTSRLGAESYAKPRYPSAIKNLGFWYRYGDSNPGLMAENHPS